MRRLEFHLSKVCVCARVRVVISVSILRGRKLLSFYLSSNLIFYVKRVDVGVAGGGRVVSPSLCFGIRSSVILVLVSSQSQRDSSPAGSR